jgi:hypothetical protein
VYVRCRGHGACATRTETQLSCGSRPLSLRARSKASQTVFSFGDDVAFNVDVSIGLARKIEPTAPSEQSDMYSQRSLTRSTVQAARTPITAPCTDPNAAWTGPGLYALNEEANRAADFLYATSLQQPFREAHVIVERTVRDDKPMHPPRHVKYSTGASGSRRRVAPGSNMPSDQGLCSYPLRFTFLTKEKCSSNYSP